MPPGADFFVEKRHVLTCAHAAQALDLANFSLEQSGRLGQLIVRQAELYARLEYYERRYGETCPRLPRDIINFLHDPLACAIALGRHEGVEIETIPLRLETREGWLYEIPDRDGIPTRLVTKIDGNAFNEYWFRLLCRSYV